LRGGSTPLISNCVAILNTRFPFNNDRSVIRETLNKEGCGLNDLKSHFNSVRLYTFGFSIRDLLDAGFSINKLLQAGLENEIYTEFNSMNDDDKHKVVEFIESTTDLDSKKVPDLNLAEKFPDLKVQVPDLAARTRNPHKRRKFFENILAADDDMSVSKRKRKMF